LPADGIFHLLRLKTSANADLWHIALKKASNNYGT